MANALNVFPVAKNGVFFGYADMAQVTENPALEVISEAEARSMEAKAAVLEARQIEQAQAAAAQAPAHTVIRRGPRPKN